MMDQMKKVFQEHCTPAAIKRLNYELLLTTANERFGTLQFRANDPKYPEFEVLEMKLGNICGLKDGNPFSIDGEDINDKDASVAYFPISLTIKGYKGEDFKCYLPVPSSKKPFAVNENLAELFPTSSIRTLKNFFSEVSKQAKVRLDFGYDDPPHCSDR